MTNISITTLCNRNCEYCFAQSVRENSSHMQQDIFSQSLEYLKHSGMNCVRLLGGEPTIHPLFTRFLDIIEERGMEVLVFSNGCIPKKAVQRLLLFPADRLKLLINTHPPDRQTRQQFERFNKVCRQLHSCIMLGYNIYSPQLELDFLPDLVRQFSLLPAIRLGIAHPCIGVDNICLHPRHYRKIGKQIGSFIRQARQQGIAVEFDCGFVPCMFSDNDLAMLNREGQQIGTRCNPLPDLLPDGRCIPCYPLANVLDIATAQGKSHKDIQSFFVKRLSSFRAAGIFKECGHCPQLKMGMCVGGCLAAAMKRMRCTPFTVALSSSEKTSYP